MVRFRRVIGPLAAAWLFGHAAAVTMVPLTSWLSGSDAAIEECRCAHGPDATCPMHHKASSGSKSKPCAMRSADDSTAETSLTSVFGVVGLAERLDVATVLAESTFPSQRDEAPASQSAPPQTPPPRA